jgi:peptidyl-dipeptidase A
MKAYEVYPSHWRDRPIRQFLILLTVLISVSMLSQCRRDPPEKAFIDQYVTAFRPLGKKAALLKWQAFFDNDEATKAELRKVNNQIASFYGDSETFDRLVSLRGRPVSDQRLRRQLDILYNLYLPFKIPKSLRDSTSALDSELQWEYDRLPSTIMGLEGGVDRIYQLLQTSTQPDERKKYWQAWLRTANHLESRFRQLISLRNRIARQLQFRNYYVLMLALNELDERACENLLDDLEKRLEGPFARCRRTVDEHLARRYGIPADKIQPWHYPNPVFLTEERSIGSFMDDLYQRKDIIQIGLDFFHSLGMDLGDIIQASDFVPQNGKTPGPIRIMVDRENDYEMLLRPLMRWEGFRGSDLRIRLNIRPGAESMALLLHQLGHGAYIAYINKSLPYVLRQEASIAATEAVAFYFGGLIYHSYWLRNYLGVPRGYLSANQEQIAKLCQQVRMSLVFEALMKIRFEQAIYENPEQDLNALWWRLRERYQKIRKPRDWDNPDYLINGNYIRMPLADLQFICGFLMSAQLRYYFENVLSQGHSDADYLDVHAIGRFLKTQYFSWGATYPADVLFELTTGEKLNPAYLISELVRNLGGSSNSEGD